MTWLSANKKVEKEIMKTDIFCEILYEAGYPEEKALSSLEIAFSLFRDFEQRYSRFLKGNELWNFNESEGGVISEELFRILQESKRYHEATGGLFDPSILPALEAEGYAGVYNKTTSTKESIPFLELSLDHTTLTAKKPFGLKIDLGGIGKGLIADKVSAFLGKNYRHHIVDAGGDIFAKGSNQKESYPYWAIDIEHPFMPETSAALLLLSDMAVATSGKNRRHWIKNGSKKHHIIDPITEKSASSDLLSVTVIAENVTKADVFAKTLFIAGKERGILLAETLSLPAIFIDQDAAITINRFAESYVWKS